MIVCDLHDYEAHCELGPSGYRSCQCGHCVDVIAMCDAKAALLQERKVG